MTCEICGRDATDEPFDGPQDGACPYAWNDNPAECYRIGYEREHAIAEEAKKIALKLSVEVSEQKARADAADAELAKAVAMLLKYEVELKDARNRAFNAADRCSQMYVGARCELMRDHCGDHSYVMRGMADAALAAPAAGEEGTR